MSIETSEHELLEKIDLINNDFSIHGLIIQLPLPSQISNKNVINAIKYNKDVDGLTAMNIGLLYSGFSPEFIPCTAQGCLHLIKLYQPSLAGKRAIIIGRSNIVGKPLAALLLQENCTVTICHSYSENLSLITSEGDIVVVAIGKGKFLTREYFNKNAIIIDVGINRINNNGKMEIVGDIDFINVQNHVSYITPVPGGVGPMTIAYLLNNTFKSMIKNERIKINE